MQDLIFALNDLKELTEDSTVPKNVKARAEQAIKLLQDPNTMNVSKAVELLVEVSDDQNIQSQTRTQIMNILSKLE
ncbi:MAG: UPF0147 family protein [Candidatus Woesearchaeota archaeon]|nr:UPF0147 family protein [Candidatus Woesearchaeota archaeon]